MAAALQFLPMCEGDLDWVAVQERELHAFPWSRENFRDSLAAGYGSWMMREEGLDTGYAVVLAVLDEAHLLNLSVVRHAQGKGHGARFLAHLLDQARCAGATQFFLEVRPTNLSARALYAKTGFVEIGRRKAYYPAVGGREDAIVMRTGL